jgi:hypothetical protein
MLPYDAMPGTMPAVGADPLTGGPADSSGGDWRRRLALAMMSAQQPQQATGPLGAAAGIGQGIASGLLLKRMGLPGAGGY